MPTVSHDTLHGFLPGRPRALERALRLLDLEIPSGIRTEPLPTDASSTPTIFTRDMDTVRVVKAPDGTDSFILLVEAQTEIAHEKETSWPYYVAYLRDKYKLQVVLLVLCVKASTAKWAATPLTTGVGRPTQVTVPHVLGPDNVPRITSRQEAAADLDFAAFSVWIHSRDADIEGILTPVGEALAETEDRALRGALAGQIEDGLGTAPAREFWRNLMSTLSTPIRGTIVGDAELAGREAGRVSGELAHAVSSLVRLLERRGLPLTEELRERVTNCTELAMLDLWFDRAIDAVTIDEVFAAPSTTDRVPPPAHAPEPAGIPAETE